MLKKIIFGFLAFYTLVGFIIIPFIIESQVESIIEEKTTATIKIQDLYFNPYRFLLTIEGLKLHSQDDKELINIKLVEVNIEILSLLRAAIHIGSVKIEEPKISLELDKNKNFNFISILKKNGDIPAESTQEESGIPRIILDHISIVNGRVKYEDYSNKSKFELALDSIGFELNDVDTQDIEQSDAKLRFYMKLADGGFIDLRSEVLGMDPFIVKGSLGYEASKLYTQWRYVKDKLNIEVADGKLSLNTNYYFNIEDLPATTLSNLNVNLKNIRLKPKVGNKDILNLKAFNITNATIKPLAQTMKVEAIGLDSLRVKVQRGATGLIDWLELIKVESFQSNNTQEEKSVDDTKPWDIQIKDIALEKIQLDFEDSGIKPNTNTTINDLNFYAQNVTLKGDKPFIYQMNLLANDTFSCKADGSVTHNVLDVATSIECSGLDVKHYASYIDDIAKKELQVYDIALQSLVAGFDANLTLKDSNASVVVDVSEANVNLDTFVLNKKSTNKRLVAFNSFSLDGITFNTSTKDIAVKTTRLNSPDIRTTRLANGSMNIENLIVPKRVQKETVISKATKKEKDFRIKLHNVFLENGKITFKDKALSTQTTSQIDRISLSAKNIDSSKNSWMDYAFSARVNRSGKVSSSGEIRHTPLKQKGTFVVDKVSLKGITPYLQEHAYVYMQDGYVSLNTKTSYGVSRSKPDLNVEGSFTLDEIFVNDSRNQSALLSFSQVDLKKFTLETLPNRLFIEEVDIDAFYVNASIDANRSMNLSQLLKTSNDVKEEDSKTAEKEIFPVRVTKVNVKNGSASFSDASLPIHFKTNMHNLNGSVVSLSTSSHETSYIDIVGDIDKYGSTKLKGEIKSADPKAFTDLEFSFRNLELSAMSGYSATFAGYELDDGKLFLNLNYDIKDSQLTGENSIIVKNIKLGKEVEIEGGSLPLGFVIALLEDSNGVMDIDMPIRGNVDEPDFKYGALAWKTFGNLILKAVTSPFRFLGAMLGVGGEELEFAEFEGGSSVLLPSEREKLDNVSKLMFKRPKILLNIVGGYNQTIDKQALQKEKLISLVVERSGAKNEKEKISAMTVDLLEDIYEDIRDDDKHEELEEELENKYEDETLEQEYLTALIQLCSDTQDVTQDEIMALAKSRAEVIQKYLIQEKSVTLNRVKVVGSIESQSDEKALVKTKLDVVVK